MLPNPHQKILTISDMIPNTDSDSEEDTPFATEIIIMTMGTRNQNQMRSAAATTTATATARIAKVSGCMLRRGTAATSQIGRRDVVASVQRRRKRGWKCRCHWSTATLPIPRRPYYSRYISINSWWCSWWWCAIFSLSLSLSAICFLLHTTHHTRFTHSQPTSSTKRKKHKRLAYDCRKRTEWMISWWSW